MKRNFWTIAVAAILVAVFFHLFGITDSFAGAWDSRSPDVVRAEGIVQGVNIYTLPSMEKFKDRAVNRITRNMSGEKAEEFRKKVKAMWGERMSAVEAVLAPLITSRETGAVLVPSDPRFAKLFSAVESANRTLFVLFEEARRVDACEDGRAKGTITKPCF